MAKLIYTVLMSLDGYIADKSGNLVFAGDLTTEFDRDVVDSVANGTR